MTNRSTIARLGRGMLLASFAGTLAACSTFGAAGPSTRDIAGAEGDRYAGAPILVVDLDSTATSRLTTFSRQRSFANVFGGAPGAAPRIERGDLIAVTLFEAPPAVLFGTTGSMAGAGDPMVAGSIVLPEQRVSEDGSIAIPFAGTLQAAGRSAADIQREIVSRLRGKANDPQAIVRLVDNQASNVTILGEVANSRRVPLSARGERVLDILAQAGGTTEDVDKITVRLSRGARAETMPLESIILDPAQNVPVRTDDVITVLHQPYSFIALGAVQRNAEVPFEGGGVSLAQALGRIGGLRDDRSDVRGVFVFRFEDRDVLDVARVADVPVTSAGRVPVIYRVDLSEPTGIFVAQDFMVRDDDVLYVSSALGADLQRFIATLSNFALSTIAIRNSI